MGKLARLEGDYVSALRWCGRAMAADPENRQAHEEIDHILRMAHPGGAASP
jgi:hypothetical protein